MKYCMCVCCVVIIVSHIVRVIQYLLEGIAIYQFSAFRCKIKRECTRSIKFFFFYNKIEEREKALIT